MLDHSYKEYYDLFSLAIVGLEIFGNEPLRKQLTPKQLRGVIRRQVTDKTIRNALIDISRPNNLSACGMLKILYNEEVKLSIPSIDLSRTPISTKNKKTLEKMIHSARKMSDESRVYRSRRAYTVLVQRLSDPTMKPVHKKHYRLYVASIMLIFSSLFSRGKFTMKHALMHLKNNYTPELIFEVIGEFIDNRKLLTFILLPSV